MVQLGSVEIRRLMQSHVKSETILNLLSDQPRLFPLLTVSARGDTKII